MFDSLFYLFETSCPVKWWRECEGGAKWQVRAWKQPEMAFTMPCVCICAVGRGALVDIESEKHVECASLHPTPSSSQLCGGNFNVDTRLYIWSSVITWNELQQQNITHSECQPNVNGLLNRAAGKSEECLKPAPSLSSCCYSDRELVDRSFFLDSSLVLPYQPLCFLSPFVSSLTIQKNTRRNQERETHTCTQMNSPFTSLVDASLDTDKIQWIRIQCAWDKEKDNTLKNFKCCGRVCCIQTVTSGTETQG